MKYFLLLLIVSCSGMSEGKYRKEYHLENYHSSKEPSDVHALLTKKMTKCYPQSAYPVYEKTVSVFNPETNKGSVRYEIDNQSMGPRPLVLVDILKSEEGSLIQVYSKGDMFRPPGVYKHHIKKWINDQKVDCQSRGQI